MQIWVIFTGAQSGMGLDPSFSGFPQIGPLLGSSLLGWEIAQSCGARLHGSRFGIPSDWSPSSVPLFLDL